MVYYFNQSVRMFVRSFFVHHTTLQKNINGGVEPAFFLVAYILYMTPYSKCGREWDRKEEEERGED